MAWWFAYKETCTDKNETAEISLMKKKREVGSGFSFGRQKERLK